MQPLPGGLVASGVRQRDWAFHPVSGALELALAQVRANAHSTAHAVTRCLATALARLGDAPASRARVAALCVADRQFLMRELECHLGHAGGWFQADCQACRQPFDFHLDYADLPVQPAGDGYPVARVTANGAAWHFRLPTGADQEAVAGLSEVEAMPALVQRLMLDDADGSTLDRELMTAAEAALEAMAPAIVLTINAHCPDCDAENEVELDPYRVLHHPAGQLLGEVHQLAMHYHWSEAEILGLPRARRQHYLQLIDRARGMTG